MNSSTYVHVPVISYNRTYVYYLLYYYTTNRKPIYIAMRSNCWTVAVAGENLVILQFHEVFWLF